ncbi:hypothetical protein Pint_15579 [Pistacia integerrima]|uniref:Uncharacterized protein n=1 Tax=Pistacia integerrima TaxID=434235 RepID=A0ACC0ZDY1_9ROSI|nr:hypothetical protein Pint_15579 [Pistacia integerrima]
MELPNRSDKKLEDRMEKLVASHEDLVCYITESLEKLNQQISSKNEMGDNSANKSGGRSGTGSGQNNSFVPKTLKIDFSRYDGKDDPTTWVCKAKKYFALYEINEFDKVNLASFYFESDALLWFQMLEQESLYFTWQDLRSGLFARFGPNQFEDPFGELIKLRQAGLVIEYQCKFERLLAKAGALTQDRKVTCFITGLKDSIHTDVQANRPTTLVMANGLAKLFEARDQAQRRTNIPTVRPANPPRKNIGWEDKDGDVEKEIEGKDAKQSPEISLHAMAGSEGPKTMRIWGGLMGQSVVALIDSGSTHNFISSQTAQRINFHPNSNGRLEVMAASGEKLSCPGKCSNVQLRNSMAEDSWTNSMGF